MNAASQSWHHTPSKWRRGNLYGIKLRIRFVLSFQKHHLLGNCYRQEMHILCFFRMFLPNFRHVIDFNIFKQIEKNFHHLQPYLKTYPSQPVQRRRTTGSTGSAPGPGRFRRSSVVRGTGPPAHGGNARPRGRSPPGPEAPPVGGFFCWGVCFGEKRKKMPC